jgi:hypothetical protein
LSTYLLHPIGNKNIGIPGAAVIAVAAKNKFLSIRAKHGESIESFIPAYLLDILSVKIHLVHIERKTPLVLMVTAEYNMFTIGSKIRRPVGLL